MRVSEKNASQPTPKNVQEKAALFRRCSVGRQSVQSRRLEFRLARVFPSRLVFLFVFFDWMPVGFPRNRRSAFSTSVSATTRLGCPQVPSIRRKMTLYVDTSRVSRRNSRTERRTPRVSTVAAVAAPTSRRAHRRTSRPAPRASPARVGPFRFKRSVVTPSKQRGQDVRNRPHVHDPDADRQAGVAA
jgi:hypothetical protein